MQDKHADANSLRHVSAVFAACFLGQYLAAYLLAWHATHFQSLITASEAFSKASRWDLFLLRAFAASALLICMRLFSRRETITTLGLDKATTKPPTAVLEPGTRA
jgi:hypothetical protein